MSQEIYALIAKEIKANPLQVEAAINLIREGATVPFIARYRKEVTNGLDDGQLRVIAERLEYLEELNDRRKTILQSIRDQDKLTPELEQQIQVADTKTRLEDLYLPFRPKRRSKAQTAREAGLEPLAFLLLDNPSLAPLSEAQTFINAELGIETAEIALEGAQQIIMEKMVEEPTLINRLREYFWNHGRLKSLKTGKNKKEMAAKFSDYFNYSELVHKIPSHRALALFRGRRENVLSLSLSLEGDLAYPTTTMASYFKLDNTANPWLLETVAQAWKTKLSAKLELELLARLREAADEEAIKVFAKNLKGLLLASPAGQQVTLGLDPGIRTGVKGSVIDATGKLLDYTVIFPFAPQNEWHQSMAELAKLIAKYDVKLIAIGNGTGSRETEKLVAAVMKMYPDLAFNKMMVSEAGASVYSASELAALEFPDLDVTIRGAVSIARRLQDPLAELVKITPKSIGVGQYQHDVNQRRLSKTLEGVMEDCVNLVGVDLNTASVPLLTSISGLNEALANNIVAYRDANGCFKNRLQLLDVPRMGEKTFQQCAGFLRITLGDNLLDSSSVHPEAYPLVTKILAAKKMAIKDVIGNLSVLKSIEAKDFVDEQFGLPTIHFILKELEKPGRDPRPDFKTASFKEGVEDINDLALEMILEGVVTNVTNFGAFIDIGVHQDGLVHISALTDKFITDPHQVVKAGDIVTVKVIEVDKQRRRIGLTMRLKEEKSAKPMIKQMLKPINSKKTKPSGGQEPKKDSVSVKKGPFNTAMADALARLKGGDL